MLHEGGLLLHLMLLVIRDLLSGQILLLLLLLALEGGGHTGNFSSFLLLLLGLLDLLRLLLLELLLLLGLLLGRCCVLSGSLSCGWPSLVAIHLLLIWHLLLLMIKISNTVLFLL